MSLRTGYAGIINLAVDRKVLRRDEPLVVAVSGGADSLALLLACHDAGLDIVAAHFNHRLRGPESEADAAFVQSVAALLGVQFILGSGGPGAGNMRSEDEARRERYRFLGGTARSIGATRIAVAHTPEDLLETILLRIARGTGPAGLAAMGPESRIETLTGPGVLVVRPFLDPLVSHDRNRAYCSQFGLPPREDGSNEDIRFSRNRIRRFVIPELVVVNSQAAAHALSLAKRLREQSEYIRSEAVNLWDSVVREAEPLTFDRAAFNALPAAIASEMLRLSAERLTGSPEVLSAKHIDSLLEWVRQSPRTKLALPHGLRAIRRPRWFRILVEAEAGFAREPVRTDKSDGIDVDPA